MIDIASLVEASSDVNRIVDRGMGFANRALGRGWRFVPMKRWVCPCCSHSSAFAPTLGRGGVRRHSRCPHCGANERHRLAAHAIDTVVEPHFSERSPRVLHVAPEASIGRALRSIAGVYETGDLLMKGVDHRIDLCSLPFEDASFDLLWASHVLEIVRDDRQAIAEIRRVLRPGGVAVLPVPLLGPVTIDYPRAVTTEFGNWHAPGWDYDQRLNERFDRVEWYRSSDASPDSQTLIFENRSKWPSRTFPFRRASEGRSHPDGIPICWVD